MSTYILNLEQFKIHVDTLRSFSSLIWLKWAVFGHFCSKSAKKRCPPAMSSLGHHNNKINPVGVTQTKNLNVLWHL